MALLLVWRHARQHPQADRRHRKPARRRSEPRPAAAPPPPGAPAEGWGLSSRGPSPRARRASSRARPCGPARCRPRRSSAPASGRRRYGSARSRHGCCSAMIASITGCLQSRQPMPAVRAAVHHPGLGRLVGVDLVELPDRAALRVARVAAAHARRVGRHAADLCVDLGRLLAHRDRVAVALAHLRAVEAGQLRRPRCAAPAARAGSSCRVPRR